MTEDTAQAVIAFPGGLGVVIDGLRQARLDWRAAHARHAERGIQFPSRHALRRILRELGTALFSLRLGPPELTAGNENGWVEATLESILSRVSASQLAARSRAVCAKAIAPNGPASTPSPAG